MALDWGTDGVTLPACVLGVLSELLLVFGVGGVHDVGGGSDPNSCLIMGGWAGAGPRYDPCGPGWGVGPGPAVWGILGPWAPGPKPGGACGPPGGSCCC